MTPTAAMLALLWVQTTPPWDIALDARLSPAPPWRPSDPVELNITMSNSGAQARLFQVDFDGLLRSDGLVAALQALDDNCPFRMDRDLNPNPDRFFLLGRLATVPAHSTLSCRFRVVAHPLANGARVASITIYPGDADATNNVVRLLFEYGGAVRTVPAVTPWGAVVAAILLLAATALRGRRRVTRALR